MPSTSDLKEDARRHFPTTPISERAGAPALSVLTATTATLAAWNFINLWDYPLVRLSWGRAVFFCRDAFLLLFVFGQKDFYLSLLREMRVLPAAKVRFRPQAWQDSDAETSG